MSNFFKHFKENKTLTFLHILILCAFAVLISFVLIEAGVPKESMTMIFIIVVMISTFLSKSYLTGIISSLISVFLFNFFFVDPFLSFRMKDIQDVLTVIVFLSTAIICGTMSSSTIIKSSIAEQKEKISNTLYEVTKSFFNAPDVESTIEEGLNYIEQFSKLHCKFVLFADRINLSSSSFYSKNYSFENDDKCSILLPVTNLKEQIGKIYIDNSYLTLGNEDKYIIKSIITQMTLSMDKKIIDAEKEKIKRDVENEKFKTTLLRSVSHDIRSSLTGIKGCSSTILEEYDILDDKTIKKLVSDINEETEYLVSNVQNILEMTRLSSGKVDMHKDYEAVDDLINQTYYRFSDSKYAKRIKTELPKEILLCYVDGSLVVKALINLVSNAIKHSGEDSEIIIRAYKDDKFINFEVSDNGCGIEPSIMDTLFDSFVTQPYNEGDKGRGVGLGLAICRAITTLHNGKISAQNKPEGGAKFTLSFPISDTEVLISE